MSDPVEQGVDLDVDCNAFPSKQGEQVDVKGQPGVMHPVDQAFYDLTVKQRNAAWAEAESLRERVRLLEQREKGLREVAHQLVGWSRTVGGGNATDGYPTLREIVKNADAALVSSPPDEPPEPDLGPIGIETVL